MGMTKDDTFRLTGFAEKVSPADGATVNPLVHTRELVIETAALAALTIAFQDDPKDGQRFKVFTKSTITALTLTAGASPVGTTFLNAVTTLVALNSIEYVYNLVDNQWYRCK